MIFAVIYHIYLTVLGNSRLGSYYHDIDDIGDPEPETWRVGNKR